MSLKIDNGFTARNINLETFDFPTPTVRTWTDLFGNGSKVNVAVDAKPAGSYDIRLYSSGDIDRRDASHYKQEAEGYIEEWVEDNKGNWLREIDRCARYVHAHNVKQLAEYSENVVASEAQVGLAASMLAAHEELEATK